jgi:hypothetical protein
MAIGESPVSLVNPSCSIALPGMPFTLRHRWAQRWAQFVHTAALLMTYTRAERVVGPTPRVIKHEAYRYVCGSCS